MVLIRFLIGLSNDISLKITWAPIANVKFCTCTIVIFQIEFIGKSNKRAMYYFKRHFITIIKVRRICFHTFVRFQDPFRHDKIVEFT